MPASPARVYLGSSVNLSGVQEEGAVRRGPKAATVARIVYWVQGIGAKRMLMPQEAAKLRGVAQ